MSKIGLVLVLPMILVLLSGCNAESSFTINTIDNSLDTARTFKTRAEEYAAKAPTAPYDPQGEIAKFKSLAEEESLYLDAEQLQLILGAANILGVDSATLATIVELELRGLDSGELDRDIVSALAGENTSIGIAQVRLSTAVEIENEDTTGLFPTGSGSDSERTERIRRLAADDWSVLYAASYIGLLNQRFPGEGSLEIAQRYTGRAPGSASQESKDLLASFGEMFGD